jgi:N-dimethylarginine dimethylaminohydrolase
VVGLELADPEFYHLDTCLAALDRATIAWVPAAFTDRSRELIDVLPLEKIAVPEAEARASFAANLHCPDGDNVIIDQANTTTIDRLTAEGYTVHPVDTSEFRKAGGSVFCLTNQLW